MESFIDTNTITDDEELLKALKHNNKVSSSMKQEIKEMEKLDEANKKMSFKIEKQNFEEDDEYEEEQDEDSDYLYYYEPIKDVSEDISITELEKIIKENLPSKNNPNYFKIISRMMAEILKEIMEYEEIKSDSIGEKEIIEETQKLIDLNKRKINFIRSTKEKETNEEEVKENNLYFLKTTSGNIYCLNDLDKIKNEYYESFEELFKSIKDGTFKRAKRLNSNNLKTSSLSEVRGFKTRVLFDKLDENNYIIIMCAVNKCDYDNGYKKSLETRGLTYRAMKPKILSQKNSEESKTENKDIEKKLFLKLENRRG